MLPAVSASRPGFVGIVREFLTVDHAVRGLFELHRAGQLRFADVDTLFASDEGSALFRLKERCHALFRAGGSENRDARHREVLFDLAVGSLFHEAMKLRENLYQREVYAPRVRALGGATDQAAGLFREFERILTAGSESLEAGMGEIRELLDRTREQLAVLLAERPGDGHVVRYLLEHRPLVEEVFGGSLEDLLTQLYGSAHAGYAVAGRSYLASGYYGEAECALGEAVARGGDSLQLEPEAEYARGMHAYLRGGYGESIEHLGRWLSEASPHASELVDLAHAAISKVDGLASGEDRESVVSAASKLLGRLSALRGSRREAAPDVDAEAAAPRTTAPGHEPA
jgi:tetratricopeptide (TPR) repeat protein